MVPAAHDGYPYGRSAIVRHRRVAGRAPGVNLRENLMRAAVVPAFGQPLVIEDRPVPEPGPGQVVVQMEASGLCHTDIHAANGDWPVTPTVPFIPGHEGVGIVTATGDGVTSPRIGQRVSARTSSSTPATRIPPRCCRITAARTSPSA
jgi:Alcohol dehydrogenase GroES-like domain